MEISIAHTLQGISTDFLASVFWYKMMFVGTTMAVSSFLGLVFQHVKSKDGVGLRILLLLGVFPLLTSVLIFTNEAHGLFWNPASTPKIAVETLFPSAAEAGIWYWIYITYAYSITGLGCFILIQWILQSQGFYSRQSPGVVMLQCLGCLAADSMYLISVHFIHSWQPLLGWQPEQ